ncbi:hypothetical protein M433DRAFT_96051 [Acidomyces richmondensis BFW]|nr:MAG: hypothetical protein FE78DRAFT_178559 [Acidomyces sp. 'richmondensis']KYG42001.1 hypothetical protein M433DRAFT_96051 [Acidomyces richmondensis BFW]
MAASARPDPSTLEECDTELRKIISNLFILIAQAHDYQGPGTQKAISDEIKELLHNLVQLSRAARRLPTHIPIEIIKYVEQSRNPDIYTREFVELVMRYNQQLKGQSEGFAAFRDILAKEMSSAMPEIKRDVLQIVQASGGQI